ncbi:acyclic terpene utilization AtuA family protein [Phycicoccus sp. DTK01]|uniref:acyclic terpene utilization AtuA family protein n=1 Tax=Phycicoccus sp. DTK01 TaxID=2785745 RepID=UPI001A8F32EF|nr:acyclic terpene utilization AtuA family protein [Phycicoccus sp. DTK01]GIL34126.1 ABC transporter substrate-binding protein [Phycicoccus sp. DTK01]
MKSVTLGAGMAFWGDSIRPAIDMVERADIQYLCCDHLAELTMAILSKRMERDPEAGFTPDVVDLVRAVGVTAHRRGIRIVSNAGGANPHAAARAVAAVYAELGLDDVRIAVVTGDDVRGSIDDLMAQGVTFENIDTRQPLSTVRPLLTQANVYTGSEGIVEALQMGADVVICGRVTDIALYLGPMIHELGWARDDWDRLAAGTAAAHVVECGAQSTGGLFSKGWQSVPGMVDMGYPTAEVFEDGSAVVSKTPGSGGEVTVASVSEQMVYEVLDTAAYLTADVTADFTGITLEQVGPDRVRVDGVVGREAPRTLKVNMGYRAGFVGSAQFTYTWPDAKAKADRAVELLEERLERAGFQHSGTRVEYIGANSIWSPLVPPPEDPEALEVTVRYAARCPSREEARKVFSELVPICNNGPAGMGGLGTRLPITEQFGIWPALIPREMVQQQVEMLETVEVAR